MLFLSVIKQNTTEGIEYVLSYNVFIEPETEINSDQFNPLNDV